MVQERILIRSSEQFLRQNWGYAGNDELGPVMWAAIARWLRAHWGYVGNDEPGPVMRAALQRAETANYNELA
jgi:carbonic anhydrase